MAALPTIDTTAIEQRHANTLKTLEQQAKELAQMRLTLTTATMAQELDTSAKLWLESAEKERVALKAPLLEATRRLDTFWKRMMSPAESARSICRRIIGDYSAQERRRAEQIRLENERVAREEAERLKQAHADELLAQAAATGDEATLHEALAVAEAPVVPVVVATPEPVKVAGASVRMQKVGTVRDPVQLLLYLVNGDRKDLINEILDFKQSGLNAALRRGLELPGVDVHEEAVVANRSR